MAAVFFEEILCVEGKFSPQNINLSGFNCFKKFFLWINEDKRNITTKYPGDIFIHTDKLLGIEVLLKLAFLSTESKVTKTYSFTFLTFIFNDFFYFKFSNIVCYLIRLENMLQIS